MTRRAARFGGRPSSAHASAEIPPRGTDGFVDFLAPPKQSAETRAARRPVTSTRFAAPEAALQEPNAPADDGREVWRQSASQGPPSAPCAITFTGFRDKVSLPVCGRTTERRAGGAVPASSLFRGGKMGKEQPPLVVSPPT